MRNQPVGIFVALSMLLAFASPAGAASSVDLTYDLSDTDLTQILGNFGGVFNEDLLGGSMKIRYASNSASSMPIVGGPATLKSLTLSAYFSLFNTAGTSLITVAQLNLNLISPVAGSLLSGGTLTFGSAQLRVTGTRHCNGQHSIFTGLCIGLAGTLTSLVGPLGPYTTTAPISFAASPGPNGGAQSTRHTVSGTISANVPTKFVQIAGVYFMTGANLVGREVLREAEGHDPKVTPIPEPGTLLLIGAGTAGLALVGRATRRSRRS